MKIDLTEVEAGLVRSCLETQSILQRKRDRMARRLRALDERIEGGPLAAAALIAKGRGETLPPGENPRILFGPDGSGTLSWPDPKTREHESHGHEKAAPTPKPVTLG